MDESTKGILKRYEWRYTSDASKVTHGLVSSHEVRALCGLGVESSAMWMGTGTQDEYEKASRLPKCRRCLSLIFPMKNNALTNRMNIDDLLIF